MLYADCTFRFLNTSKPKPKPNDNNYNLLSLGVSWDAARSGIC